MTPIVYVFLTFTIPSNCRPTADAWQLFIDADFDATTGTVDRAIQTGSLR